MKRILLVITIIILLSVPSLANSEKIISLSSGMSTGVMGFTVEKLNGGLSYYTGFGVTPSTLRLAFGSRIYLPEKNLTSSRGRSNVFIGPNLGFVWERNVEYQYDKPYEKPILNGYNFRYWLGLTGGYDHRWGSYDEYRLTIEGGIGYTPDLYDPYIPILNISLGYSF